MAIAERVAVKMNRGVTLAATTACFSGGIDDGLSMERTMSPSGCLDGLSQRVVMKRISRKMCEANKIRENPDERNFSSPTNRQFTVHLNMNCLLNSNARDK